MKGLLGLLVFVLGARACFGCTPSIPQVGVPVTVKESDLQFTAALVDPDNPNEILCSGTLISNNLIVTSKYCVEDKSEIVAFFGINSYPSLGDDETDIIARSFTQDDIHFSPLSLEDSTRIALLRLNDTIEIGDFIKPIGLAPRYMFSSLSRAAAVTSYWTLQSPQTLNSAIVDILSVYYLDESSPIEGGCLNALKLEDVNDSGAPLYIIDKSGVPRLLGINIQSDRVDINSPLQSYVLIDNYLDWLLIEILKDCPQAYTS